jgi:hypothetical protein
MNKNARTAIIEVGFIVFLFLFQFVDGGIRAIRHRHEKGLSLGDQRYFHAYQFWDRPDRCDHQLHLVRISS